MFYPPLGAIIGSVTTSVAIAGGGVALMVLPSLVVGNQLLILGGVAAVVGAWSLAHRHGRLRGMADAGEKDVGRRRDNQPGVIKNSWQYLAGKLRFGSQRYQGKRRRNVNSSMFTGLSRTSLKLRLDSSPATPANFLAP